MQNNSIDFAHKLYYNKNSKGGIFMKKLLAITLTLVMLLGTIGISVSAEPNEIQNHFGFRPGLEHMPTYIMPVYEYIYSQDNNFVYCLNEDNTIHLVGYIGE